VLYTGLTDDQRKIDVVQFIRQQMQAIGHDTTTWDQSEPYLQKSITVTLDSDGRIDHVKNPDGVWTVSRHAKDIKAEDTLCIRNEDNEIEYHTVSKVAVYSRMSGPYDILFDDDYPQISASHDRHFVCLTPAPEQIPF
jgi:hypothetical protein